MAPFFISIRELSFKLLSAENKIASQILLSHNRIISKFLAGSLEKNLTLEEQISAVGNRKSLGCIMVGNQNSDILFLQLIDHALNILHRNRVDTGKRLVEHDELGIDGKTTGYLRTSAFATRQTVAEIMTHFFKAEFFDKTEVP